MLPSPVGFSSDVSSFWLALEPEARSAVPGKPYPDGRFVSFLGFSRRSSNLCSMIEPFEDHWPDIDETAFVATSADLIGRVCIGQESSVWYNTTLRGDIHEIVVGPRSNVQDNAVLHVESDRGCYLGELVTIGHGAIVHACTVRDEVLVGMGATVLDGAVIGERSIIGANTLVTMNTEIPPGSLVLGSPGKVVRQLSRGEQAEVKIWAQKYVENRRKFLARDLDRQ